MRKQWRGFWIAFAVFFMCKISLFISQSFAMDISEEDLKKGVVVYETPTDKIKERKTSKLNASKKALKRETYKKRALKRKADDNYKYEQTPTSEDLMVVEPPVVKKKKAFAVKKTTEQDILPVDGVSETAVKKTVGSVPSGSVDVKKTTKKVVPSKSKKYTSAPKKKKKKPTYSQPSQKPYTSYEKKEKKKTVKKKKEKKSYDDDVYDSPGFNIL